MIIYPVPEFAFQYLSISSEYVSQNYNTNAILVTFLWLPVLEVVLPTYGTVKNNNMGCIEYEWM